MVYSLYLKKKQKKQKKKTTKKQKKKQPRHTNKTNKKDKQDVKYIILIHFIYISSTHFAMYSYLSGCVSIFLYISSKVSSYSRRRKKL